MQIKLTESIWLRCQPLSAGEVIDLPELDARQLIALGHAEAMHDLRNDQPAATTKE